MIRSCAAATLLALASLATAAHAAELKITDTDGKVLAQYSQEDAEALGRTEIKTTTPWTEGVITFSGVNGQRLMTDAGFEGATVTALALDDYAIEIAWEDFERYNALLATHVDGKRLTPGRKGPFWIIFDFDGLDVGEEAGLHSKSVWNLVELEIE